MSLRRAAGQDRQAGPGPTEDRRKEQPRRSTDRLLTVSGVSSNNNNNRYTDSPTPATPTPRPFNSRTTSTANSTRRSTRSKGTRTRGLSTSRTKPRQAAAPKQGKARTRQATSALPLAQGDFKARSKAPGSASHKRRLGISREVNTNLTGQSSSNSSSSSSRAANFTQGNRISSIFKTRRGTTAPNSTISNSSGRDFPERPRLRHLLVRAGVQGSSARGSALPKVSVEEQLVGEEEQLVTEEEQLVA